MPAHPGKSLAQVAVRPGIGGVASGSLPKERLRMAIGIRIKLPGVTQEQFDQAHDHANPDRTPPNGLLFHASGPIDGGWESSTSGSPATTSTPSPPGSSKE